MIAVRIVEFSGDPSGAQGNFFTNRAELMLEALPPVGSTVFFCDDQDAKPLIVKDIQLVVAPDLTQHYAVITARPGQDYKQALHLVSPPMRRHSAER